MVDELIILDEGKTIFDTDAHYVIPRYQRAYAWEDKEIIQLIDDINGISDSENYYIGSLVVSKIQDRTETYEVVDGQQRLTTLYLLLQFLVWKKALVGGIGQNLSFDCRASSNFTLSHIQDILSNVLYEGDEDRTEQSILKGIDVIKQKFSDGSLKMVDFVHKLQHVILYRIEVPKNTDLNRYFEIMNTRGEQLEQHDILKAQLMGNLSDRKEQNFFARVWEACSDMTGYVQMHFSPAERQIIFGSSWNEYPSDTWSDYAECIKLENVSQQKASIKDIIERNFVVEDYDGTPEEDVRVRFDSIIDFPYFLLHTLRVFVSVKKITLKQDFGELLDDKKLITDFKLALGKSSSDEKGYKAKLRKFSRDFIMFLLQARYLFDCYIIKREYTGEDNDGEWSMKELHTSGQQSGKKAYYTNTSLRVGSEWEKTSNLRCKESLMIQSALRVSYTSPKVMHWITFILEWLFNHEWDEISLNLTKEAEDIAKAAVKDNFLSDGNYKLGVRTPHIVFNFLDYLLWKGNKKKYSDFDFEFRNSVEHWYPQNPSEGTFEAWKDKDTFGNLCIIPRSVNSKFSNLSPESKMKSFGKMVSKGSLKLRIMGEIIQSEKCSNQDWIDYKCKEHEDEMISILSEACE